MLDGDGLRRVRRSCARVAVLALALHVSACAPRPIEDPYLTLGSIDETPARQERAMEALDLRPFDDDYRAALRRVIWQPGYTPPVRVAAATRLLERDPDALEMTLALHLPRMQAWAGVEALCAFIADEGLIDLTPALIASWARPNPAYDDEYERPECTALERLHGDEPMADLHFDMLLAERGVSDQALRSRIWQLLHRLGERERLVVLLTQSTIDPDDGYLVDLQAAARAFGLVPFNREEILWLRTLRKPEFAEFWTEASSAVARLTPAQRATLEVRDLPVAVAAARHEPELFDLDVATLEARVEGALKGTRRYAHGGNYDNFRPDARDHVRDWRDELTWGDLAAISMAMRAMEVPQVVAHLFDYADRDHRDTTTEYGGVIALDHLGRFEVLEFVPRLREHDQKFVASQEMLDAAYTAVFHFHFHVQRWRNASYAGPGFGDHLYADALRANCLVLTGVDDDRLDVDYYRHGRVEIDLGVIERP